MKKEYKHKAYIYNRHNLKQVAIVHYDHKAEAVELISRIYGDTDKYGVTDIEQDVKPDGRAPNLYAGID
jgi:hypothetical protein